MSHLLTKTQFQPNNQPALTKVNTHHPHTYSTKFLATTTNFLSTLNTHLTPTKKHLHLLYYKHLHTIIHYLLSHKTYTLSCTIFYLINKLSYIFYKTYTISYTIFYLIKLTHYHILSFIS